jgi:hypothetical protein
MPDLVVTSGEDSSVNVLLNQPGDPSAAGRPPVRAHPGMDQLGLPATPVTADHRDLGAFTAPVLETPLPPSSAVLAVAPTSRADDPGSVPETSRSWLASGLIAPVHRPRDALLSLDDGTTGDIALHP